MTAEAKHLPGAAKAPAEENKVYYIPQRQLIWRRFRKHRLAMLSLAVVILIYLIAAFVEFLAPYPPDKPHSQYPFAPPQQVRLFDTSNGFAFAPYVSGYDVEVDPVELRRTFIVNPELKVTIKFYIEGESYRLLGLFETNIHLFGPEDPNTPMFLLGTDRLGRDLLSRLIYGTRISMSIGLAGVSFSLVLGVILGGLSGYYGGTIDNLIQRLIDFTRSLPTIPLWLGLAAAFPLTWDPLNVYFAITVILSLIGWTGLARVVRGKFLSLRQEDYVRAARLDGADQIRIIFKYMLPSFYSHIIAAVTLAIPQMILAETALSFLGLGLRPPIISWGVLLQEAQNVQAVAQAPWLLTPALAVIVSVLALNFLGDGLRDAADPYA